MSRVLTVNDGDYIQLPWGMFEFHNNEVHVVTGVNDPSGLSFRGAGGSKVSWKNDQGEEMVLLQLRRNPNNDGEYYLGALDQSRYQEQLAKGDHNALDHAMIEVVTINPDGVEFRVPVKFSAGSVGNGAPSSQTGRFYSGNGQWVWNYQDDGSVVMYATHNSLDETTWTPQWAQRPNGDIEKFV